MGLIPAPSWSALHPDPETLPTRAELAREEMPTGTRRLCEHCALPPEHAEQLAPTCQHSFKDFPLCSGCGGEGGRVRWTPGCTAPDPATEELCGRCEGTGVEGLL